ncbi:menaquinone biosynthesis protein [Pontibacter sp. G13]|uniref:menaquinone biosynthetic enzyme MqnA/MqnD family protein n=1 Tax=Pontibacter sp. G13 TaxID=3074898 RepID=UPI00288B6241|nr:menaquinone biosynthesis protein [Pontibacter sp. G13]WNJ18640.1 menaquinone biosynthesis protein [Pontibacter sp. G13]
MMETLHIALVSYINTRPFMDGFDRYFHGEGIEFHLMPPADCARHLHSGDCQMALVPVGSLLDFQQIGILPNYCIGANGPVESVCIFSHVPIEEVDTLILDSHSRSSNGLAMILLKHHWNISPQIKRPLQRDFDQIQGKTAGVIIGDQAIRVYHDYPYVYDLSAAWQDLTGLPFAFAVWAYQPDAFSPKVLGQLETAMGYGVANARQSAQRWADHYQIDPAYADHYLHRCIDYRFDPDKHRAMEWYLSLLKEIQIPAPQS